MVIHTLKTNNINSLKMNSTKNNIFSIFLIAIVALLSVQCSTTPSTGIQDKNLEKIFDKLSSVNPGVAINLDSSFGGSKCNCVCKDMK